MSHLHLPKYIGPGVWYVLHSLALDSDREHDFNFFKKVFLKIIHTFGCEVCKQHALKYIKTNPPSKIGPKYLPSEYINKFHNTVNVRLGKPIYTLEKSRELFKEVCHNCLVPPPQPKVSLISLK